MLLHLNPIKILISNDFSFPFSKNLFERQLINSIQGMQVVSSVSSNLLRSFVLPPVQIPRQRGNRLNRRQLGDVIGVRDWLPQTVSPFSDRVMNHAKPDFETKLKLNNTIREKQNCLLYAPTRNRVHYTSPIPPRYTCYTFYDICIHLTFLSPSSSITRTSQAYTTL